MLECWTNDDKDVGNLGGQHDGMPGTLREVHMLAMLSTPVLLNHVAFYSLDGAFRCRSN